AAGSVTIMNAETGQVLYEDAQHERRYPASITKIMTALLVLERVEDLSEPVTFSPGSVAIPWYASRAGMQPGDTLTVMDALYALMLISGNEVAWALAEHVSGSIGAFTEEMNARAISLGAENTRFINPCGLPGENQYTTSYDMALIMREAIQSPVFNRIISTSSAYLPPTASRETSRPMLNTNRLIREDSSDFNEWVVGGKTGFTNDAQHTLVTYSEIDGHPVIISLLYVTQRGAIFSDTSALLEFVSSR
ncbi:MAG: serine hydrolase, partial [Defluviitaleaceae bacterium]|nr:serine hydrolase [Defluviitaleaceae bacterium]